MFFTIVFSVHIILCVVLIGLVLVQQGKGADLGAAMGGGANTVFGAGGATNFIVRLTTGVAVAFMITSILMVKSYSNLKVNAGSGVAAQSDLLDGSAVSKLGEQTKQQQAAEGQEQAAKSVEAAPEAPKTAPEAAPGGESAPAAVLPPPPAAAAPAGQSAGQ